MPSAVELEDGALLLRPWTEEDARFLLASGETSVVLCTHPDNDSSQRVAERAGFRPDGEVAEYARFSDGTTRALRFAHP